MGSIGRFHALESPSFRELRVFDAKPDADDGDVPRSIQIHLAALFIALILVD
jgi:hypothetical protein